MDIKTVDDSVIVNDPIYNKQKEGVAKMRASLLSCTSENGISTRQAIQNITALRVYHQLMRIIKYTEMMDKLETKLYESLDYTIQESPTDTSTVMMLLGIQSNLQKSMIDSHKLLEPYLNLKDFMDVETVPPENDNSITSEIMKSEDRDRLRTLAQATLKQLKAGE